jgi:hypothetical protein
MKKRKKRKKRVVVAEVEEREEDSQIEDVDEDSDLPSFPSVHRAVSVRAPSQEEIEGVCSPACPMFEHCPGTENCDASTESGVTTEAAVLAQHLGPGFHIERHPMRSPVYD